jgi:RNA polymerase sigma-70 factor, ECF subfamily
MLSPIVSLNIRFQLEETMGTLETTANANPLSPTRDLLEAAKAGDPEAFQELTQRAVPIIFRRALEITSNHHDAEDVLQETLLKGFTHISQFRGDSQLSTWLVRIGLNEAIMTLRKRRRDVPLAPEAGPSGKVEESPVAHQGEESQTDSRIVRTEVGGLLNKALRRLPARARQVLHLRYFEGYSIEETAKRLNLSRGSVKAYACRSRARLRRELRRLLMPRRKAPEGARSR